MENEIWLPVIDFENRYFISNKGNVKANNQRPRILKGWIQPNGYLCQRLFRADQTWKAITVHRLVAIHFISNPENKPEVNHIDGNKLNNAVENLQWCTSSENQRHAFDTGLQFKDVGYNNPLSKSVIAIFNGEKQNIGSMTQASIKLGMSRSCILRSIRGNRELVRGKFKGYSFIFEK